MSFLSPPPRHGNLPVIPIAFGLMIVALFALVIGVCSIPDHKPGPAEAFEAHLAALDEGRLDDARALVDITCGKLEAGDVNAAKAALKQAGFTFQTAFRVSEVWLNSQKTEAILELDTPKRLPLPGIQGMMKVEGDWRLSCG